MVRCGTKEYTRNIAVPCPSKCFVFVILTVVYRGDEVEVVLNLSKNCMSYVINGEELGIAFDNMQSNALGQSEFYPVFALFNYGQVIRVLSADQVELNHDAEEATALLREPLSAMLHDMGRDVYPLCPELNTVNKTLIRRTKQRNLLRSKSIKYKKQAEAEATRYKDSWALFASLVEENDQGIGSTTRLLNPCVVSDGNKQWAYRPGPVLETLELVNFGTLACDLTEIGVLNDDILGNQQQELVQSDTISSIPCTYIFTEKVFVEQDWYHCEDCDLVGNNGCCAICAIKW